MMKTQGIQFSSLQKNTLFLPKPASAVIPEWYKNTPSYLTGKKAPFLNGELSSTIKKCIPVFDAITAGYIIFSPADIYVSKEGKEHRFTSTPSFGIEEHINMQAMLYPNTNGEKFPKFINPWIITTPKGYSCLFTQPFHRESPFTLLDGIVDTDTYRSAVNFPFTINDPNFEGMIPAGTPLAQVIPFKRDVFKMKIVDPDVESISKTKSILNHAFFDRYKNFFWTRKEYR
jgi:hypothetical protein